MLNFRPQIVHFCGHGEEEGLVLEDKIGNKKLVDCQALAELFELLSKRPDRVECVILNTCYSEVQAEAITRHVPYVIGTNKAIGDKAAIEFTAGFYTALGAGESYEFAYNMGCNKIHLEEIPEYLTHILKQKSS
jgi:hypothetical protein